MLSALPPVSCVVHSNTDSADSSICTNRIANINTHSSTFKFTLGHTHSNTNITNRVTNGTANDVANNFTFGHTHSITNISDCTNCAIHVSDGKANLDANGASDGIAICCHVLRNAFSL